MKTSVVMTSLVMILFLIGRADGGGHEVWTLRVTAVSCLTADSTPISCTDPQAALKNLTYTIRNQSGTYFDVQTESFRSMSPEALKTSLAYRLHQKKYEPPIQQNEVTTGFTLTK